MSDAPKRWRTGRNLPGKLYFGDEYRGVINRAEDAKAVCEAMNAEPTRALSRAQETFFRRVVALLRETELFRMLESPMNAYNNDVDAFTIAEKEFRLLRKEAESMPWPDPLEHDSAPAAPLAPPAPQSEPGRWLFEQSPKEPSSLGWNEMDASEREAWAKAEADCMARGAGEKSEVDRRMGALAKQVVELAETSGIDVHAVVAELDSLRAQLSDAKAAAAKSKTDALDWFKRCQCALDQTTESVMEAYRLKHELSESTAAHQRTEASREDWQRLAELRAEMLMAGAERQTWQHETMRLKSELAAMAKAAEERAPHLARAENAERELQGARNQLWGKIQEVANVKKELESERAKSRRECDQLRRLYWLAWDVRTKSQSEQNWERVGERLDIILDEIKPESLANPPEPVPPAAVPEGGSGEDTPQWWGVWCMRLGTQAFWRQLRDGSSEILQTTRTEAERSADVLNEKQRTRIDSLGWIYEARPFPCAEQPTPDKTMTGPADKDSSSARVEGADPQTSTQSAAGSMLPTGRVQGAADPATDEGAKAAQRSESAEAGHPTQSEITRHARDDAQAAAEEARQIGEKLDAANREKARAASRVSPQCKGEHCSVCGAPAEGKLGEEIMFDDPMPDRHNYTAYVCRYHFRLVLFGPSRAVDPPVVESLSERAAGRESK